MRTERQEKRPAGSFSFQWSDASGVTWDVEGQWTVIGGRVECSALTMDSHGRGRITSTVVRQVEGEVRRWREVRAGKVRRMARMGGEVGRRASRQVAAYEQGRTPEGSPGRPRDDATWYRRAVAMREAWEQGRPMVDALKDLEPNFQESTYRKRIDRTRAWDREHGPGLLEGVGRARDERKGQG